MTLTKHGKGKPGLYLPLISQRLPKQTKGDSSSEVKVVKSLKVPFLHLVFIEVTLAYNIMHDPGVQH